MEDSYEQAHQLRALAMRVAALEDNVAFLEQWCEEQQDSLDRAVGSVAYDYEVDESERPPRTVLRVVDLRDGDDSAEDGESGTIVALVDTEHDRALHLIRAQLNRLRTRLAASLAPPAESPEEHSRLPASPVKAGQKLSVRPAGRTAP
jgi:uncharacterized coiled-coil protein SlyX